MHTVYSHQFIGEQNRVGTWQPGRDWQGYTSHFSSNLFCDKNRERQFSLMQVKKKFSNRDSRGLDRRFNFLKLKPPFFLFFGLFMHTPPLAAHTKQRRMAGCPCAALVVNIPHKLKQTESAFVSTYTEILTSKNDMVYKFMSHFPCGQPIFKIFFQLTSRHVSAGRVKF